MSSAERPNEYITLSPADRRDLVEELANVFNSQRSALSILRATTYPPERVPIVSMGSAQEMWEAILWEIDCGIMVAGYYQLLTAALGQFPYNRIFRRLSESYIQSIAGSPGPEVNDEREEISSTDSSRRDEPESDASLPAQDIRFSLADRRDLVEELANVFNSQRSVESVLRVTTFPRGRILPFGELSAEDVWGDILHNIDCGAIRAGHYQLLTAVVRLYPKNLVFRRFAENYLGFDMSPSHLKAIGHAFISYVREDSLKVDMLQRALETAGVRVWRDTAS
jgi:glycine cleavage system regulatory protein